MTARIPDHAALPADELRRLLWASVLDQKYPQDAVERGFARAMNEADDAARAVLEALPLPPSVVVLNADFWKYALRILGGYHTSLPTGVREGKRWCRHDDLGRWIGEYGKDGALIWRQVVLE